MILFEILGSVSPSLRNGLGAFSSMSVVLFFSFLQDWFCHDFVEILSSVSPSLRNELGALSSLSVVFFSTLLDWFCDEFVEILCSVSPAMLCNGLGTVSTVSAAFCFSILLDWDCDDFVEILCSVSPSLRNGLGVFLLCQWFCFSQLC